MKMKKLILVTALATVFCGTAQATDTLSATASADYTVVRAAQWTMSLTPVTSKVDSDNNLIDEKMMELSIVNGTGAKGSLVLKPTGLAPSASGKAAYFKATSTDTNREHTFRLEKGTTNATYRSEGAMLLNDVEAGATATMEVVADGTNIEPGVYPITINGWTRTE